MTSKGDIEKTVAECQNILSKNSIDATKHIKYILPLLFFKYLSDSYKEAVEKLEKDYSGARLERQKSYLPFKIADENSFQAIYAKSESEEIGMLLNDALRIIEMDNTMLLKGVLTTTDYNRSYLGSQGQGSFLSALLEEINVLDLRPSNIVVEPGQTPNEVLGMAFESILTMLAKAEGSRHGNFYTPEAISEIMAAIVNVKSGERVYDPTCGSGSSLIKAVQESKSENVSIYGQEINGNMVSLAKMNMFIHGIEDAKIIQGDTLKNPQFLYDEENLLSFDAIVADFPFALSNWRTGMEENDRFHRFDWGTPPAGKSDWAFLLHMIKSMSDKGRIATLVFPGVLFRGGVEANIRQRVVDENLLDAVIGLPDNLLYGTALPACIMVFKKNRNTQDVLFIDASKSDGSGNASCIKLEGKNILAERNITAVIQAYRERKDKDKYAHLATLREIQENDYSLNIPLYVDTFEENQAVDMQELICTITKLRENIVKVEKEMDGYLKSIKLGNS